jgi:leucyl aminopeptidase
MIYILPPNRGAFVLLLQIVLCLPQIYATRVQSLPRACCALHKRISKRMLLKNSMMTFDIGLGDAFSHNLADIHLVFVGEGGKLENVRSVPEHCQESLRLVCAQMQFQGRLGEQCVATIPHVVMGKHHAEGLSDNRLLRVALIGLGRKPESDHDCLEQVRRAMGHAMRVIESSHAYDVALEMPHADWCADVTVMAREIAATLMMASYDFDTYLSTKAYPSKHYTITLYGAHESHDAIQRGILTGMHIGYAVNQARYWSDSPPSVATPRYMADQAELLAARGTLACTIFDHHQIKAMGMGGLTAVGQGSVEPPRLVVLEYRSTNAKAPTVVLVGKGVTFDSGGISIKPADRMDEMKYDMAGAAAIMASMEVIAEMKPEVNVISLMAFTENMPSGSAVRPGDIVRFYNGLTAEIKNTDAEGRLILADALSYAVKHYQPHAIIDVATLTGSCMYALGKFFAGLMTQHYELGNRVIESACRSGDRVWVLPLHNDYRPAVKSSIADIANLGHGSYYAGAITAAFFLQHFVDKVPWVHLDIAGTAWDVPQTYYRAGATGFGVRLLVDLIMNWPVSDSTGQCS